MKAEIKQGQGWEGVTGSAVNQEGTGQGKEQ